MTFEEAKELAASLREKQEKYSYQYYVLNQSEVSDFEFDRMMHQLMELEEQYPELLTADSITHRVGGVAENSFESVDCIRRFERWSSLRNFYRYC